MNLKITMIVVLHVAVEHVMKRMIHVGQIHALATIIMTGITIGVIHHIIVLVNQLQVLSVNLQREAVQKVAAKVVVPQNLIMQEV